jgi:alkylation response protein AidB-like acyl-CoA dehydrogenase
VGVVNVSATIAPSRDFDKVLEGVRDVARHAAERAEEIEHLRSIPPDLYDELEATGYFRSLAPLALGGFGFTLADVNELVIEGAKGDGSLGWVMMIGGHGPIFFAMMRPEAVADLLAATREPRFRGAIAPKGVATPVDGGYVVSGQWPFASGGPGTHFVAGNCIVMDNGAPRFNSEGIPELILAVMPADRVEFLDTWHVLGMRGTDSCDFAAHEVFVPGHMTTTFPGADGEVDAPWSSLPIRAILATGHASVAIGIARGALEEITRLAQTKRATLNPTALLADDPVFLHNLGEQSLRLRSAKALLDDATAVAWDAGLAKRQMSPVEILQGRTMAGYVTAECVKVVDAAYTAGGSTSVYDGSALQRRLRDIHVATQHVGATGESYRTLGRALVGGELTPMDLF